MAYIYLDTCHIQKIKGNEYSDLRELLRSGILTLVFSQFNLLEMIARTDRTNCLDVANSIASYNKVYLNDKRTLFKYDIFKSRSDKTNLNPFSDDFRGLISFRSLETFINSDVLNKNFSNAIMTCYDLDDNERFVSTEDANFYSKKNKLKNCIKQKQQRNRIIFSSINSKFLEYAESNRVTLTSEEKKKLSVLSPSFLIPYVIQLQLLISKGDKLLANDLIDANHCCALPYVDVMVIDNGAMDRCNKALSLIKQQYNKTFTIKIASDVSNITKIIEGT
ncbi:TPA: hypothetical protein ACGAEL_001539 [Legionella pneumophila]|uniref:hypothetical protein n=1 Tax=Legionella pneumophila TaxID=446 RepID=UPI00077822F0|nr:hypothetical protein [Legionella pneumophila]HCC3234921.1 hypothetical protein [Legionella pneumophila subsp. pneumophila]HAT8621976.1 hypothetical protein [Legionella pneumophila]HAU9853229.1 hypothetical protein [Legionella pneumophila]HAU9908226.1 hypothetical protein [Legionella pneumophila]HAV0029404.1 hypothetical protein [Legionella pneumophila]